MTQEKKIKSILLIAKEVSAHYGYTLVEVTARTQKHNILRIRQFIHYFCVNNIPSASLYMIGSIIGGKDHATVLNSKKVIQNLIDTEKEWKNNYDILNNLIDIKLNGYECIDISENYQKALYLQSKRKAAIRHKMPYILQSI